MLEMKNGFVVTDDDCMQCRKNLGDRKVKNKLNFI